MNVVVCWLVAGCQTRGIWRIGLEGWSFGRMCSNEMDGSLWMWVVDRLLVGKPQHRVKVVYLAGVPFGSMKN
jgi:hypothetical protein